MRVACSGLADRGTVAVYTPGPVDVQDGLATPDAKQTTVTLVIGGVPRFDGGSTGTTSDDGPGEEGVDMPGADGGPAVGVTELDADEQTGPGATPLDTMVKQVYGTLGRPENSVCRGVVPTATWVDTTAGAEPVVAQVGDKDDWAHKTV